MTYINLVKTSNKGINSSDCAEYQDNENKVSDYYIEDKEKNLNQNFVNTNDVIASTNGININSYSENDMNYYQETRSYYHDTNDNSNKEINNFDSRSMFKDINGSNSIALHDNNYDPEYDMEVNKLLQEIEEDLFFNDNSSESVQTKEIKSNDFENLDKEIFEDYYDEFFEDSADDEIPEWYNQMIQNKIKETKSRLEVLSTLICYTCTSNITRNQIIRIEQDHNTPFCKLDYPRHPPFSKPWHNYWRFNFTIKCKLNLSDPSHVHTSECEILLLEHVNTGITTKSDHLNPNEFPSYLMHAVELFEEFATHTYTNSLCLKNSGFPNSTYEKPIWSYIKLRSNYKNELMLIACGKGITPFLKLLKKYFTCGPGRSCNVVSLYCINAKWSQRKHQLSPLFITGCLELRDKIGPITINYNPKTNISFNSVQAHLLGKIILDYLSPNMETTLIDLGCNYGVLSLMLAHKCDKVIGLYTLDHQIKMAEEIKSYNNLHNISFIVCNPKEVHTKCSSLIKKCISVAVLNLASPFGKSFDAIKALRNLPSLWRVVVYGSFTKEFHKYIAVLTSKNECVGDEFLPMQGSILDKSPLNPNEYDIIILFERKALIKPSIKLIASGPTVNVKTDIYNSWTFNDEFESEKQLKLKIEKEIGNNIDHCVKNPSYKSFSKTNHSSKFGVFDNPPTLKKKDLKSETVAQSIEDKYDCPVLSESRDTGHDPQSITYNMKIKDLKKMFNSSSLSNSKRRQSEFLPTSKFKEKPLDSELLSKFNKKLPNCLSVAAKKNEFDFSITKTVENSSECLNLFKKESVSLNLQNVKLEFEHEKEDGELSPEIVDIDMKVPFMIKSKPNLNNESESINIANDVLIKYESISTDSDSIEHFTNISEKMNPSSSPNKIIKTETLSVSNVSIKTDLTIDNEKLTGMKISHITDLEDFENMVTPKSTLETVSNKTIFSPSPLISTNFVTIDGFHLSVKPNQSFLSYKTDPDANDQPIQNSCHRTKSSQSPEPTVLITQIKQEKHDDVEFIKEQALVNKTEKKVKIKKEQKKFKDKLSKDIDKDCLDPDLRKLIEKRKDIKKQLDRDREQRKSKQRYDHSTSLKGRRYRSPFSPSDRRYRFSPSRRSRSSLSPNRTSNKKCRSPLSSNRISDKRGRSPLSPSKTSDKNCKSSLSPNRTTDRRCRSPRSPSKINERRRCRSSLSPTDKLFKNSPQSPRYKTSPASPTECRFRYRRRSKSPFEKKKGRSPTICGRRSRSRSPVSMSPSPSRRYSHNQYNQFSKYKKRKSLDDVTAATEKKNSNTKCNDQRISAVSPFSDNSHENHKRVKKEMTASPSKLTPSNSLNVSKNIKQEIK